MKAAVNSFLRWWIVLLAFFGSAVAQPNIVLFIADDHGLDAGCYGNAVIKTPHLDALAREGTLYRRAFCTAASCSPSRSVILTGLHNHANGQLGLAHSFHHFASYSSLKTLPVILSENGYRTARIGKFHVAPEEAFHFQSVLPSAQGSRNPVRMAENCSAFIAEKGAPFFLYFCSTDPHRSAGVVAENPARPNAFGNEQAHPGVTEIVYDAKDVIVPPWLPDTATVRAELAQYYQSVSRVDQGLGRLVQLLKDAKQYENTLIVYTSDNGSPMPGSKTTLYEPGMRLPLVVRAPDTQRRGIASDAMISWTDFTPTLLDFAGVKQVLAPALLVGEPGNDAPPERAKKAPALAPYEFHGRSFRATIDAEKPEGWDEVYASHTFHEVTMYYPMRAVRTARYKLILNLAHELPFPFASDLHESATWQSVKDSESSRYGKRLLADFIHRPRYEMYDLEKDPDEVRNIATDPAHRATFDELSAKLKAFQTRTRDPWVSKYRYE